MIDVLDASDDRLRLAVARATLRYGDDELFECVADPDPILRTAAARALHMRGTRHVFDCAMALTVHPRHDMREIGAFVPGQLGTPERPFAQGSFEALGPLLKDAYWEVRRAAAGAIGTLGDVGRQAPLSVQEQLTALSDDPVSDVRASVAVALGTIDDPQAATCLERLMDDEDPVVRDDAELGLELRAARGFDGGRRAAAE